MNFMKNPSTIVEWSDGQKFAAEFLGTGTLRIDAETGSIPATPRQVSMTIPMQLTTEGVLAYRDLEQHERRRQSIKSLIEAMRPFWRFDDRPEDIPGIREIVFFGKRLNPAPAHIEKLLTERDAWDTVYKTCHAKIREVLDAYVDYQINEVTAHEALTWLSRICIQACDRIEHYDLCYSLEFTVDEDFD